VGAGWLVALLGAGLVSAGLVGAGLVRLVGAEVFELVLGAGVEFG
jgi:hypothetical protein